MKKIYLIILSFIVTNYVISQNKVDYKIGVIYAIPVENGFYKYYKNPFGLSIGAKLKATKLGSVIADVSVLRNIKLLNLDNSWQPMFKIGYQTNLKYSPIFLMGNVGVTNLLLKNVSSKMSGLIDFGIGTSFKINKINKIDLSTSFLLSPRNQTNNTLVIFKVAYTL